MKKSWSFDVLSDRVCDSPGCHRRLKLRRVVEHKDAYCYKCNQRHLDMSGKKSRKMNRAYKPQTNGVPAAGPQG